MLWVNLGLQPEVVIKKSLVINQYSKVIRSDATCLKFGMIQGEIYPDRITKTQYGAE